MDKLTFYILDVFAETCYAGNQLAVIRDAGDLSDDEMQKIAKEMNYSETTFILSDKPRDGGYDVRIFTPDVEIPFAGHPSLGAAYIVRNEIQDEPGDKIILNEKIGQIPVTYDGSSGILWMKQVEPVFGEITRPGTISELIGVGEDDIDKRFPVQEVSTGLPFIIVPLKTLDAVKRAKVATDKLLNWAEDKGSREVFVFCRETYSGENDINARMFAECAGVPEDPATGSANGCLAGYLVKYRYFGSDRVDVRVEQGYEIGRPSLLYLKAEEKNGKIDVAVGGKVVMVAKGRLV